MCVQELRDGMECVPVRVGDRDCHLIVVVASPADADVSFTIEESSYIGHVYHSGDAYTIVRHNTPQHMLEESTIYPAPRKGA